MSIFQGQKDYASKWEIKSVEAVPQCDIEATKEARIVEGDYGLSVRFTLKAGNVFFIPVDKVCAVDVDQIIDLNKAKVVTFSKSGKADVIKIRI